ncbi:hypothetical protein VSR01_17020 [Actinacidiphila sp. DG2A-62]|uniref:hypothetical protein n=1 Tax=Actinacidiphila sp. DG2A-62 TaxID=3108821 RepID=UPI002DB5C62D|nr:hypothetical protein [Actinacidiphila sp. DG2A-62]MEC3995140.1 hypothetical protein [Actinacidiphila sp. DG2A-62]
MTRPQRYPGASTDYWWQDRWPGSPMAVNALVMHTTESTGLPDYGGGEQAPTLTAVPDMRGRRLVWHQHFDIDVSARALENRAGGVETNTLNCAQVELVGTCVAAHRGAWGSALAGVDYVYWPEPPDWALEQVAAFVAWLHTNHGVPLAAPPVWLAYGPDPRRPGVSPASYGASPARMTPAQWTSFRGVCGHSHVPENSHGDPGAFPITKLLAMAAGTHTTEDEMTTVDLTPDAIAKLVKAIWDHTENSPTAAPGTDPSRRAGDLLRYGDDHYAKLLAEIKAVGGPVLTDGQVQALADRITAQLGDTLADRVIDRLAARLQPTPS